MEGCFVFHAKKTFETKREEDKQTYIEYKVKMTLERAMRIIEKQKAISLDIESYYDSYQVVSEFYKNDSTKFDSAHEVAACIELLRKGVKVKTQQRIGRKRVDFILPELKIVLEIDGGIHKFKIGKDSQRDLFILNELNKDDFGWEIVRIPTSFIENNIAQLVTAVKGIYKEKQNLRRKYNGFIPSYYSRSNRMTHISALNGVVPDYEIEEMEKDVLLNNED